MITVAALLVWALALLGSWTLGGWLWHGCCFAWRCLHEGWPLPKPAPPAPVEPDGGPYRASAAPPAPPPPPAPEPVYFMYRNARREGEHGIAYVFEWTFSDAMQWRTEREYPAGFVDAICSPSTVRLVRRFGKRMLRERRQGLADGVVR